MDVDGKDREKKDCFRSSTVAILSASLGLMQCEADGSPYRLLRLLVIQTGDPGIYKACEEKKSENLGPNLKKNIVL